MNKEIRKAISLKLAERFQLFILNYKRFKRFSKVELHIIQRELDGSRNSAKEITDLLGMFGLEIRPTSEITDL